MMLTRHSALWNHATYEKGTPPGSVRLFDDELVVAAPYKGTQRDKSGLLTSSDGVVPAGKVVEVTAKGFTFPTKEAVNLPKDAKLTFQKGKIMSGC